MESSAGTLTTAIITALGGYAVVIGALFAFLSKVWLSRIIERDRHGLQKQLDHTNRRLQTELDKDLHIGKVQFEMELAHYKAIWACLVDLRSATLAIRPVFDQHDPNESKEERIKRRYARANAAFKAVQEQIENHKPFFAPAVYEQAREVIKLCHTEAVYADFTERPSHEYWDEAMANHEKIMAAIDSTCTAIRERVWEVRVAS